MTTSRRLVAIVATDVIGYSRLMGADEEGTRPAMRKLQEEARGVLMGPVTTAPEQPSLLFPPNPDSIKRTWAATTPSTSNHHMRF